MKARKFLKTRSKHWKISLSVNVFSWSFRKKLTLRNIIKIAIMQVTIMIWKKCHDQNSSVGFIRNIFRIFLLNIIYILAIFLHSPATSPQLLWLNDSRVNMLVTNIVLLYSCFKHINEMWRGQSLNLIWCSELSVYSPFKK